MQDSGNVSSARSTLSLDESENEKEGDPPPFQASTAEKGSSIQLSPKICKMIVRFICKSVLSREEISRLLKKRFSVTPRNLMSLTLSQLLEVVSKKPARHKYVESLVNLLIRAEDDYDKSEQGVWNIVTFHQFKSDDADFMTVNA